MMGTTAPRTAPCCPGASEAGEALDKNISGRDIRDDEKIAVAGDRALIAFDPGSLGAGGQVEGNGALDNATGEQAVPVHRLEGDDRRRQGQRASWQ